MTGTTRQVEIDYAKSNNTGTDIIWYTEVYSDRLLINLLLLLIGKSTDTQTTFGTGNCSAYSGGSTGIKESGTMNANGLFWGSQDMVNGVKIFGMEHMWGNTFRAIAGWIIDKGVQKVKMTYGQSDGSSVDGYNLDGTGYISILNATPGGTSNGYISKMAISEYGLVPAIASGSATTYYNDGLWFNNSQINYPLLGGDTNGGKLGGLFCSFLQYDISGTTWCFGAAVSCKPLALTT